MECVRKARDTLVVLRSCERLVETVPDLDAVCHLDTFAIIVSARASGEYADRGADFVSRFFAPKAGVNEDPVTGGRCTSFVSQSFLRYLTLTRCACMHACMYVPAGRICSLLTGAFLEIETWARPWSEL